MAEATILREVVDQARRHPGLLGKAPIGLVADGFALAPWLGVLGFVGVIVWLYGWMLTRSGAVAVE